MAHGMQLRRVAPRTSREYRKVFLTSATVVMLLLTLVILLQGVNALFLPPSWVPRLLYVVLMLFLTMSVLHTVAGYAGNLQQMSPTDRRTELRRTLHGTQGIILSIGVVCMLVLVPIASMWRAQPPTFDWMRLAYGVGFAPASFARLDALGYVFGALLLLLPILGCSCFFCQFLQVGRPQAGQPRQRSSERRVARRATPFIDLVENRTTISVLTPALFICARACHSNAPRGWRVWGGRGDSGAAEEGRRAVGFAWSASLPLAAALAI